MPSQLNSSCIDDRIAFRTIEKERKYNKDKMETLGLVFCWRILIAISKLLLYNFIIQYLYTCSAYLIKQLL